MSIFLRFIEWAHKLLTKAKDGLAKASVFILEDIKPFLDSSVADITAGILDSITKSELPEDILNQLRRWVPIFLTAEGLVTSLTPDSTEDEVKAALDKMLSLFKDFTPAQKAEFYTTVVAKIYVLAHGLETGETITFGEAAAIVEEAYEAYVNSKTA